MDRPIQEHMDLILSHEEKYCPMDLCYSDKCADILD